MPVPRPYRFALRPRWIASHVLVLGLVTLMVVAGFWQLRRYDERRDLNRLVDERRAAPTVELDEVVSAYDALDGGTVDESVWRRVTATGTFDPDHEVMVRNRTQDGRPGVWVLTPLRFDDGTAVVVNRGFVAASGVPDELPADTGPPAGEVAVTGLVQRSEARGRFGPTDPAEGRLDALSRVDLERLQRQLPYDLYPVWLLREAAGAAGAEVPVPVPPPDPESPSQNLSYAVQWFSFTTIALIGYPFILRRQARAEARRLSRPPEPAVVVGHDDQHPPHLRDGVRDGVRA
ncbi:MAG: SURF1 family cytochrome oxidase biogenesis protein [Acidimicrobiales bacterium]